ncbi:MAG: class I SAM-dependent methyltransferase [Deltaproteobacteria bacterium]|nr:MAG: class I SAM-dependent methyltransferase [Deltaproteobacteria bacterium]
MTTHAELSLSDVSATLLLTLYARAMESQSKNPILVDEKAVEWFERLRPLAAEAEGSLYRKVANDALPNMLKYTMSLRARHFDQKTRTFLQEHPDGVVVNLGCGLDSRFFRLDDGSLELFDLDLPDVIELKRKFVEETPRYKLLACSVLDHTWMEQLDRSQPHLFLAEGLFMYLPLDEVRSLVLALQERFPGSELVCEVFNAKWLEGWRGRIMKRKLQRNMSMGEGAMFQSGLKDSRDMEAWSEGLELLGDWAFVDEDESKLGVIRWTRRFESMRKIQWVVHYRLNVPSDAS